MSCTTIQSAELPPSPSFLPARLLAAELTLPALPRCDGVPAHRSTTCCTATTHLRRPALSRTWPSRLATTTVSRRRRRRRRCRPRPKLQLCPTRAGIRRGRSQCFGSSAAAVGQRQRVSRRCSASARRRCSLAWSRPCATAASLIFRCAHSRPCRLDLCCWPACPACLPAHF